MKMAGPRDTQSRPLLEWLLERYPDTPKVRAKQWIVAGRVQVHGTTLRRPHERILDPGPGLQLLDRHATTLNCEVGWQIHPRLELLHLDQAVAVVNKGAGLISVPAPQCDISALSVLADFLAGRLNVRRGPGSRPLPANYRQLEPLPVHRLDQYTTGVFCMAMNPEARRNLIEQLQAHTMRREYLAFVDGKLPAAQGTWRNWVELAVDGLRQRVVSEVKPSGAKSEAQEAITHFEVLAEYVRPLNRGVVTKLKLRLETGRKHQIRAQAAHAGVPLIGDRVYHPGYRNPLYVAKWIEFSRQALHAETLSLAHPDPPHKSMSWTARPPQDFRQLEAMLQSGR